MSTLTRLVGALIASTALTLPSLAHAQATPTPSSQPPVTTPEEDQAGDQDVDISVPGGSTIVVTGRRNRDPERNSAQVTTVLSTADIARTGEGDIAGALSHVTGLSVVGNGYVYVRGLGDRYSLALLNGSPLPSPEPLRRVVPLDLFPTSVVSSSLVQKSFSANFPGEFGGGVINLTTRSTPDEAFLTIGGSLAGDLETTFQNGFSYYGSKTDWLGFDDGNRKAPPALAAYLNSGQLIGTDPVDPVAIALELVTSRQAVVQKIGDVPANWSANLSAGKTFSLGGADLGVIASASYSNNWLTRDITQQTSSNSTLTSIESDFRQVNTDQNLLVNGLLGFGLEFGDQTIRWTNVYIHDTIKQAALAQGQRPAQNGNTDFLQQRTGFYERQLIDTQLVGEFKFGDLSLDLRGSYANTKRRAPNELFFEYRRSNSASDPFGALYLLNLSRDIATYTTSRLEEHLYSGSVDLTYTLGPTISGTVGGAYTDTKRDNSRRDFLFRSNSSTVTTPGGTATNANLPNALGTLRPDILFSPGVVDALGIGLIENDPGSPVFKAELEVWAGYAKADLLLADFITVDAGVRYESATETTTPIQIFQASPTSTPPTALKNDYWLPGATVTFDLGNGKQVRVSGSKTVARPQFRELINQPFYDPDNNRPYRGNPFLQDSQLINAEARFEWYFGRDQRVSLGGFYKHLDHPIEAFVAGSTDLLTSYANAPSAQLYGGEFELQKYFDLGGLGSSFFHSRQFVAIANYTYTKSRLSVGAGDTVQVFGAPTSAASDYFRDGAPLTGQSDHLVNLQLGLEDLDRLSQQSLIISYASQRVVSRGLNGSPPRPDVVEKPGVRLDLVVRQGFNLFGPEGEIKLEARNLLGTRHQEFQQAGDTRIDLNTYDVGQYFSAGLSFTF